MKRTEMKKRKWLQLKDEKGEMYGGPEGSHMQIKNVAAN